MKANKLGADEKNDIDGEQTTLPFAKESFANLGVFPRMTESSSVFIV